MKRRQQQPHAILRIVWGSLVLAAVFVLSATAIIPLAQSQTYTVLHSFKGGPQGAAPIAGLLRDDAGNFYGTTSQGGLFGTTGNSSQGLGIVFRLDATGGFRVLHVFTGAPDGAQPGNGSLIRDNAGNLYGTTSGGGEFGCGTVYKINPRTQVETVLYSFAGSNGSDGCNPSAGLAMDSQGNLYGSTSYGGNYGEGGTLFRLDPNGIETVLYVFSIGANPGSNLILDDAGNLYGTATRGGDYGCGTLFKLDPNGVMSILHSFACGSNRDGSAPCGVLLKDAAGNLIGSTEKGGVYNYYGYGSIFEYQPDGAYSKLHVFFWQRDPGYWPMNGVMEDKKGNLYGTTLIGGDRSKCYGQGCGSVFGLSPEGKVRTLHVFAEEDGGRSYSSLIQDADGSLYGTASIGGEYGYGVVFKITP